MLIKHPATQSSPDTPKAAADPSMLQDVLAEGDVNACAQALGEWPTLPAAARPVAFRRLADSTDSRMQQILLNHLVPDLQAEEVSPLLDLLASEQANLRNQVIDALSQVSFERLRDTMEPAVNERLKSTDSDQRILTLNLVSLLEWQTFLPQVEHILRHEPDVNVVMTALESLLVLATEEHWPAAAQLTERFPGEPFVDFGVARARQALLGDG